MSVKTEKEELLRRYLLGEMSDQERAGIEEKFFADDNFFEELAALEDELFYEYKQHRLSSQEKTAFEKKFLVTPQDIEKAEFAEAFLQATKEISAEKTAPSFRQSAVKFFSFSNFTFRFGAAASSILLLFLVGFWIFNRLNQTPEIVIVPEETNTPTPTLTPIDENLIKEKQKEQAELEKKLQTEKQKPAQDANKIREIEQQKEKINREIEANRNNAPKSEPKTFVALVLSPLVRGGNDNSPKVNLTPNVKTLNLTLSVKKGSEAEKIKIVVRAVGGGQIWSSFSKPGKQKSIFLSIPANNLKRGDYEILTSADGEDLDSYYFRVEK